MTIHRNIATFPLHKRNHQIFFCVNKITYGSLLDFIHIKL